jgi:transcriptional regulator with XRE-family HTH domain
MQIGSNVKKYREMRGLSLPDLAARAGVSKAFLWEIESGKSRRPGAEVLLRIAEALNVAITELLGRPGVPPAGPGLVPQINDGLRAFINERKVQGRPLEPEEVESLSYVQLKGGRPTTKEQWALVYGMLKELTGERDA